MSGEPLLLHTTTVQHIGTNEHPVGLRPGRQRKINSIPMTWKTKGKYAAYDLTDTRNDWSKLYNDNYRQNNKISIVL